ncbi:MAG: SAM-dependent methyltransferase [Bacteroidetes bacterium]|nr:MAG: SAM-dependent methyltransferase [Bacteroidota bacterium]
MEIKDAYNIWADQYDTNENKTRDLEGLVLRKSLSGFSFENVLEIGCGTGKNTEWFITHSKHVTSVDFSEEMLAKAREKFHGDVEFIQADINLSWNFVHRLYDLVSFSLVLEHIENLGDIFSKAAKCLKPDGYVYVGELHPFKQYQGTKARFENEHGLHVLECYVHNLTDFIQAAKKYGLVLVDIEEYFDDDNPNSIPRILRIIFQKK